MKDIGWQGEIGDKLGSTQLLACDDGSGEILADERETGNVYRISSLDPASAVAFGSSVDDSMLFVQERADDEIPPKVREFIGELRSR